MRRRAILAGLVPVLLLIGGCGGSSHSSTAETSTITSSSTAPAPTSTSSTTGESSTTTPTATATTLRSTTTTRPASGGAGVGASSGHSKKSQNGGSTNVRVPATFAIGSGGRLIPSTVSAPAFLAVRVTIASTDGAGHQVIVHTPTPYTLAVPAGGKASVLIPGQRAGQYPIDVDGRTRGALLIGGEPGP